MGLRIHFNNILSCWHSSRKSHNSPIKMKQERLTSNLQYLAVVDDELQFVGFLCCARPLVWDTSTFNLLSRCAAIGQHSEPDASWQRGNQVIAVPSWQIPSLSKRKRLRGKYQLQWEIPIVLLGSTRYTT